MFKNILKILFFLAKKKEMEVIRNYIKNHSPSVAITKDSVEIAEQPTFLTPAVQPDIKDKNQLEFTLANDNDRFKIFNLYSKGIFKSFYCEKCCEPHLFYSKLDESSYLDTTYRIDKITWENDVFYCGMPTKKILPNSVILFPEQHIFGCLGIIIPKYPFRILENLDEDYVAFFVACDRKSAYHSEYTITNIPLATVNYLRDSFRSHNPLGKEFVVYPMNSFGVKGLCFSSTNLNTLIQKTEYLRLLPLLDKIRDLGYIVSYCLFVTNINNIRVYSIFCMITQEHQDIFTEYTVIPILPEMNTEIFSDTSIQKWYAPPEKYEYLLSKVKEVYTAEYTTKYTNMENPKAIGELAFIKLKGLGKDPNGSLILTSNNCLKILAQDYSRLMNRCFEPDNENCRISGSIFGYFKVLLTQVYLCSKAKIPNINPRSPSSILEVFPENILQLIINYEFFRIKKFGLGPINMPIWLTNKDSQILLTQAIKNMLRIVKYPDMYKNISWWLDLDWKSEGEGAFGAVTSAFISNKNVNTKPVPVIIKMNTHNKYVYNVNDRYTEGLEHEEMNFRRESEIGLKINFLRNHIPNFALVFGGWECKSQINLKRKRIKNNIYIYEVNDVQRMCEGGPNTHHAQFLMMENIQNNISVNKFLSWIKYPTSNYNDEKQWITRSIANLAQLFLALEFAQQSLRFNHNDLHHDNVLVQPLQTPKNYIYRIGNEEYPIVAKDTVFIIDYGFSIIQENEGFPIAGAMPFIEGQPTTYPASFKRAFDVYRILWYYIYNIYYLRIKISGYQNFVIKATNKFIPMFQELFEPFNNAYFSGEIFSKPIESTSMVRSHGGGTYWPGIMPYVSLFSNRPAPQDIPSRNPLNCYKIIVKYLPEIVKGPNTLETCYWGNFDKIGCNVIQINKENMQKIGRRKLSSTMILLAEEEKKRKKAKKRQ